MARPYPSLPPKNSGDYYNVQRFRLPPVVTDDSAIYDDALTPDLSIVEDNVAFMVADEEEVDQPNVAEYSEVRRPVDRAALTKCRRPEDIDDVTAQDKMDDDHSEPDYQGESIYDNDCGSVHTEPVSSNINYDREDVKETSETESASAENVHQPWVRQDGRRPAYENHHPKIPPKPRPREPRSEYCNVTPRTSTPLAAHRTHSNDNLSRSQHDIADTDSVYSNDTVLTENEVYDT